MSIWSSTTNQLHLPVNSRLLVGENHLKASRAAFLDRDGVIVEDVHFLTETNQIRVLPGVCEAIQQLQAYYYIVIVTNQSGIARGYLNENRLLTIHTEILSQLSASGCKVDAFYYCPHLPDASVPAYKQNCECRKPKPGMLLRAAKDWTINLATSFMIGDSLRDAEAGNAAGMQSFLLGQTHPIGKYIQAPDLAACVPLILNRNPAINARSVFRETD